MIATEDYPGMYAGSIVERACPAEVDGRRLNIQFDIFQVIPAPARGIREYFNTKSCASKCAVETDAISEISKSAGASSSPATRRTKDPAIDGGQVIPLFSSAQVATCSIVIQLAT